MSTTTLKSRFYREFNITDQLLDGLGLNWEELEKIHEDYCLEIPALEQAGTLISNTLMSVIKVHAVRFRTKAPLHLLEKIVRKKKENKERIINVSNYKSVITDLIGVRAIHLFKTEWKILNREITKTWELAEKPTAYYRTGDESTLVEEYNKAGLIATPHPFNYRSLHYIIKTSSTKTTCLAEIQVRTIFEEGWSEIDHSIRYPYHVDNKIYNEYLSILNKFAEGADEMGTFIKNLDLYLDEQEELADEQKHLQQKKLKDLIAKINSTDIAKEQKQEIIAEAEKLFPPVTVSFTSIFEELLNAVKVMPALTEADKIVKPLKTK